MLAADQRWSLSSVSSKTDIANAAVVIIGTNLYFAGDRLSTNGNANIGFWFYLNGTAPQINPVTGAQDFAPEHVVGDILIIADFSNGGAVSFVTVYKWVGTGGAFGGGTLDLVSEINASVAQNNVYSHPIPTGWTYITPDYPTNSFYEGFVDLTRIPLDNYCFASFLLETRNSDAINSMLGDFVAGEFGAKPDITAKGGDVCAPGGSVELCAISTDMTLTYQWYSNPELTVLVPGGNTKCITVNVTETTTFWVVATNELECTSDAVSATATVYPSLPCSIEGSLEVCPNGTFTYMGPADMVSYLWTVSGNATISGTSSARMVTIVTGQNCEDFTLSLTATDIHGCISNCQLPVNVNDILPPVMANCPQLPVALPCNPAPELYAPSLVQAWSDNCGIARSIVTAGTPVADAQGCGWSVKHIYYAIDYCGNEQTCEQVFTWKVDVIAPAIVDIVNYQLAECNAPWPAMLTTTWTDNCGVGGLTSGSLNSDAGVNVITDACIQTRLYTFTATDDCGNVATQTVTVSRKYDMTPPVIVAPADYTICMDPLPLTLSATWTNNCDAGGTLTATGVFFSETECTTTFAYTFTVPDECGNTATKTVYVTRETEVYDNCETAYGYVNSKNTRCFLEDGFNRWGWTTKVSPGTEPVTMTLYAGAAQCKIAKGTEVGTVVITYVDGNVNVEYVMKPGFALSEVHVYVGCDPYPTIKGTKTVAPGQYAFNADNLNHLYGMSVDFTDVTGDVYIIAHAVTCEVVCSCSGKDYSGNGITFDAVNLGINCAINQAVTKKISSIEDLSTIPLKVYPNPFVNNITFEFTSGHDAHAVLEIHNMLGQRIVTLMDKPVKEGVLNRVEYLPVNQLPGIYTYRLMLDSRIQTGKIVYNKIN